MTKKRVVITGLGAVSSCGNNVKDTWDAVKNGKSGISNITLFDASNHMVKIAGEVKNFSLEPYGVDKKITRKIFENRIYNIFNLRINKNDNKIR